MEGMIETAPEETTGATLSVNRVDGTKQIIEKKKCKKKDVKIRYLIDDNNNNDDDDNNNNNNDDNDNDNDNDNDKTIFNEGNIRKANTMVN